MTTKTKIVRHPSSKTVCHVCNTQIGAGNPYDWTKSGSSFWMRHPHCTPDPGVIPTTPPAASKRPSATTEPASAGADFSAAITGLAQVVQRQGETTERTLQAIAGHMTKLGGAVDSIASKVHDLERSQPINVTVNTPNGPKATKSVTGTHAKFREALSLVESSIPLYIHGPQASGKSKIAEQVAEALSAQLYAIELKPNTPNSAIMGFVDANGTYHSTPIRKACEGEGPRVLLIEEMDNAQDMHLVGLHMVLDAALDGGRREIQFPDGGVTVRPGLVIVATGNTAGFGGTMHHGGRRAFDSATASRFAYLEVTYDEALERDLAKAAAPTQAPARERWLAYVRELRQVADRDAPQLVACMRAVIKGARLLERRAFTCTSKKDAFALAQVAVLRGIETGLASKLHKAAWEASEPAKPHASLTETEQQASFDLDGGAQ